MTGADILELSPVKDNIGKDKFSKYLRGGKQAVLKDTPALHPFDVRLEDYELIMFGTPVWAYTYAPALRTFFKEQPVRHKDVALFCTHEGGMKNTLHLMEQALPDNNHIGSFDFINVKKTDDAILAASVKQRMIELNIL